MLHRPAAAADFSGRHVWSVPVVAALLIVVSLVPSVSADATLHGLAVARADSSVSGTARALPLPIRPASSASLEESGPAISSVSAGSVVRTVFPGFNASLPESFTSGVPTWQVGSPTYVPSTNSVWWPQRAVPTPGFPTPTIAPVAVFNLSSNQFDGFVTNVSNASALAYDSGNGFVYATEPLSDSVAVVNPRTGSLIAPPIPVGTAPDAIAYDSNTNSMFVANSGSANVTVIDTTLNRVSVANVPVGSDPVSVVDDPQDALVFVANAGSSYLSVITPSDPSNLQSHIPLFFGPAEGLAFSPREDNLVATVPSSKYATVIHASDLAILTSLAPDGTGVIAAVTSENGTEFALGNASGGDVVVLNSTDAVPIDAGIPVDRNVTQLILYPQSGIVFCWTSTGRILESVNLSLDAALPTAPTTASQLSSVGYALGQSRVFVSAGNGSLIYPIDPIGLEQTSPIIDTSSAALSVVNYATAERLYVGTTAGLEVYNAQSDQMVGDIPGLSGRTTQLTLDSSDDLLWFENSLTGAGAVDLATDQVAFSTGLSVAPHSSESIAIDPTNSRAFVLTSASTVEVLDSGNGTVVVPTIAVGSNVTSLVYDPVDGQVYAAGDGVSLLNAVSLKVDGGPISIGGPHSVLSETYDPSRQDVFVASVGLLTSGQGTVTVLDGSSVSASEGSSVEIPVGEAPDAFGVISTASNPTPGSAMVWVANGLSGTISVIASPPQIAYFAATPSTIDLGFPTSINVTFSGGAGPSTISYYGLPPGCNSRSVSPLNCTPTVTGTFSIAANVTDSFGFWTNATASLTILRALSISAQFSLTTFPYTEPGVPLIGSASALYGLAPYSFSWSLSDGTMETGSGLSHSFSSPGIYQVTAEVRDATGASANSSTAIIVVPRPVATVSLAPSNVTDVDVPLSLQGTVSGGTGALQQNWTFGDGDGAVGPNASHAWTRAGNYTVTFQYIDTLGVSAARSVEVTVHPSLAATFSSETGSASHPAFPATPVAFVAAVTGGTPPYSVVWSFGDGSDATGLTVSHRYATAGSYAVTATLTDAADASVQTSFTVTVSPNSTAAGGLPALAGGFASGLFLGILVGGVLAAIVLFAVSARKGRSPRSGPVSPYVPP